MESKLQEMEGTGSSDDHNETNTSSTFGALFDNIESSDGTTDTSNFMRIPRRNRKMRLPRTARLLPPLVQPRRRRTYRRRRPAMRRRRRGQRRRQPVRGRRLRSAQMQTPNDSMQTQPQNEECVLPPTSTEPESNSVEPKSQPKPGNALKCNVCFDDSAEIEGKQRKLFVTKCGHLFCNECIEYLQGSNKQCPVCGKKLKKNSSVQLFF